MGPFLPGSPQHLPTQPLVQAGARSFIITFDVYVILIFFEKYDTHRLEPICTTPYVLQTLYQLLTAQTTSAMCRQAIQNAIGSRITPCLK